MLTQGFLCSVQGDKRLYMEDYKKSLSIVMPWWSLPCCFAPGTMAKVSQLLKA